MDCESCKVSFEISFITSIGFGPILVGSNLNSQHMLTDDESVPRRFIRSSGDGIQSPGVQVGTTTYDLQRYGSHGQRIAVDDGGQIHVNWTYCGGEYPQNPRYIRWNFRYADGSWHGDSHTVPSVSGFCQLDIMIADSSPAKRTLNAWHYGGYPWISIDQGSGLGSWPGDTGSPHAAHHLWPAAYGASNNNIVMVTGNNAGMDCHHCYLTTDEGVTWTHVADFDSCTTLSHFVRASRNPGSQKIVHAWTQSIAMGYAGLTISQMANDGWYMLSTDNGVTWGRQINVTKFTPPGQMVNGDSTLWAYADVNAVFDNDDNLHIAFCTLLGYLLNDTLYFGERSKICQWTEVSDTITVISSPSIYYDEPGGWWLDVMGYGLSQHTEIWRLPADQPQLVVEATDDMFFCLWHGQDDTTDYSASGWFNGEFYGSYSTDNGLTWSDYVNLTNTRSRSADNGDCFDEDYMTAWPYVVNDSIFITYIKDKAAGTALSEFTGFFDNPVRVWIFHKGVILGTEEQETRRPEYTVPILTVYPNPFSKLTTVSIGKVLSAEGMVLKIYDVSGRSAKDFSLLTPYSMPDAYHVVRYRPIRSSASCWCVPCEIRRI